MTCNKKLNLAEKVVYRNKPWNIKKLIQENDLPQPLYCENDFEGYSTSHHEDCGHWIPSHDDTEMDLINASEKEVNESCYDLSPFMSLFLERGICGLCGEKFENKTEVINHWGKNPKCKEKEENKCNVCDSTFPHPKVLAYHDCDLIKKFKDGAKKEFNTYMCDTCKREFSGSNGLKEYTIHMTHIICKGENKMKHKCGKVFDVSKKFKCLDGDEIDYFELSDNFIIVKFKEYIDPVIYPKCAHHDSSHLATELDLVNVEEDKEFDLSKIKFAMERDDNYLNIIVLDAGKRKIFCGNLLRFTPEGKISLCAGVNPSLGFQLDEKGRIKLHKEL